GGGAEELLLCRFGAGALAKAPVLFRSTAGVVQRLVPTAGGGAEELLLCRFGAGALAKAPVLFRSTAGVVQR
ncbi:hypothetical protein CJ430_31585, partial [Klebsiella pneumoniae]